MELDTVRLASALAHAVPGAELRLGCAAGVEVVVSRHPAADLTPCAMRQVVADARRRARTTLAGPVCRVDRLTLGGSLDDLGGGVVRTLTPCGVEQRWFVTTLPWSHVAGILRSLPCSDEINATVRPDDALDVTLVAIGADTPAVTPEIDRLAADLCARILVEELLLAAGVCEPSVRGGDTER